MKNNLVQVKRSKSLISKIPSYSGGRMPLSTNLANSVRALLAKRNMWDLYPEQITQGLKRQKYISNIPKKQLEYGKIVGLEDLKTIRYEEHDVQTLETSPTEVE